MKNKFKKELIEYGKKISDLGLSDGTSGNLSLFDPKKKIMAITPSGIDYHDLKPEDIVLMKLDGEVVEGDRVPSSEWFLHAELYKKKKEARAAIHTHPTYSLIFAVLRKPIKPVHYMITKLGVGEIPCSDYRLFGTQELAEETIDSMGDSKAIVMANHGLLVYGKDLKEALDNTNTVEVLARLEYQALSIGKPHYLSEEQIEEAKEKFKDYGQKK